ncbi:MAG: APH(3') family aminoglycoside O-phosphotransferase [Lachnospiraceae bacterium]
MKLPEKIAQLTAGKAYEPDSIGMSGSTVLSYEDMVLKIESDSETVRSTIEMMQWLNGKLPVPSILCHEILDGKSYLLMSKISGRMSCDAYYMERPQELLALLAEGMKLLWSVDISDCPRIRSLDTELAEARYRVEHGLVSIDRAEPDTFGENGFESPAHLLSWLEEHKPAYEPVLSHGDFCLPNIFFEAGKVSGFIDLGDTGVGDRWRDISLCYRSLKHNFDGTFGGRPVPGFNPDLLFEALGITPNREKLRYYILLDELF